MTSRNDQIHILDVRDLEKFLDVYGADESRWPAGVHHDIEALLCRSGRARAILAEARALECVLDHAVRPGEERAGALLERIMAASRQHRVEVPAVVVASERAEAGDREISTAGPAATIIDLAKQQARRAPADGPVQSWAETASSWRSAALLAASLLLGIYVGFYSNNVTTNEVLAQVAELAGLQETAAQPDDLGDFIELDEEVL